MAHIPKNEIERLTKEVLIGRVVMGIGVELQPQGE